MKQSHQRPIQRCAIYTRKSSEEGLEQSFNSLDAQREACEAYIKSQEHEGWILMETHYDDGGYSGGTTNRPALQQLLSAIKQGEIDIIVVYKVDRLSRSLADFSNMVELFTQYDVSFVSITQQFNTSTSMGRLTLNVLLSFAQFEREVTGERIRDKIAASKKKGMWMGGIIPLGYDVHDRALIPNDKESSLVNYIFEKYLELGSVRKLKHLLDRKGFVSKWRTNGRGARPFSRGALYTILKNPIYSGNIHHKGEIHPGQHQAIIENSLWTKVQDKLKNNKLNITNRTDTKSPSLLAGLLFDLDKNPMSPTHTTKGNKRYRYYANQASLQFKQLPSNAIQRVSAQTIESIVKCELSALLTNSNKISELFKELSPSATQVKQLVNHAKELENSWLTCTLDKKLHDYQKILSKITLSQNQLTIHVSRNGLYHLLNQGLKTDITTLIPYKIHRKVKLKRCGVETKLIIHSEDQTKLNQAHTDSQRAIQTAMLKALTWNQELLTGQVSSMKEIAERENVNSRYISRILKLAFLPIQSIQNIAEGQIQHNLTLKSLVTST